MQYRASLVVAIACLALACSSEDPPAEAGAEGSGGIDPSGATGGTDADTSAGPASETSDATTGDDTGGETLSDSSTGMGPGPNASTGDEGTTTGSTMEDDGSAGESSSGVEPPNPLVEQPSLWYAVENRLNYIEISPVDGSVAQLVSHTITTPLVDGQNSLTMLDDGSLIGARESSAGTEIYYIAEPPLTQSEIEVEILGTVPDELRIEAMYTDCQGAVYLMDTGDDVSSSAGNRLIRFTGDYLGGDLSYEVITDLSEASVADIDDMGPGINAEGEITDGNGFAIDTSDVYAFDYNVGTGTLTGSGGTWGIHALGGPLFDDNVARLYLLDRDAQLYEADPSDLTLSDVLITGPDPEGDAEAGWSGLAGPLTECVTSFPPAPQ